MARKRIHELPEADIRKSRYDLEYLLKRFSHANTPESEIKNDLIEMLLCLGNEIQDLKEIIKTNKKNYGE